MKRDKNFSLQPMASPGVHEMALSLLSKAGEKTYTVLDAGAGKGALSLVLARRGHRVFACDLDPKQFSVPGITCKKSDLNKKIPFEDEMFDVVISLETIEHLENPWQFVREAYRVLKPKGKLILSTPNVSHLSSRIFYLFFGRFILFWSKRYMESSWHINPIFPWELEFILERTNFKIIGKTYNQGKLFPVFKPFIKGGKLFFGSPISLNYLPKISIFGENLIILAERN